MKSTLLKTNQFYRYSICDMVNNLLCCDIQFTSIETILIDNDNITLKTKYGDYVLYFDLDNISDSQYFLNMAISQKYQLYMMYLIDNCDFETMQKRIDNLKL